MRILRFSAIWCMNCIYMKSVWEELASEFSDIDMIEYDADDDSAIHKQWLVKDIPTVIFLSQDGKELFRLEGAQEKEDIIAVIRKLK